MKRATCNAAAVLEHIDTLTGLLGSDDLDAKVSATPLKITEFNFT